MGVVVLDTEALTGFARNHVLRAAVELLVRAGWDVEVPAVVLAEGVSGRARDDATTHRTLNRFGTVVTTAESARYAGTLRARVIGAGSTRKRRAPSGIDAIVAAHAALTPDDTLVVTSDPGDLAALVAGHPRVRVRRIG